MSFWENSLVNAFGLFCFIFIIVYVIWLLILKLYPQLKEELKK